MPIKTILIVFNRIICPTTKFVEKVVKKSGIRYDILERELLTLENAKPFDLIITVGGDGTFLTASHFVQGKTKILSVNANPLKNCGFFARANKNNFAKKFSNILKGNYDIIKLIRLKAKINGKQTKDLATNEIYFGHNKPHGTTRYMLKVGKKKEYQLSSGIVIATPFGSHGWAKSMGVKPLKKKDKKLIFTVREPIKNRLYSPKMIKGIINLDQKIEITCKRGEAMIGLDGFGEEEVNVNEGAKVTVQADKSRILFVDKC